MVNEIIKTIQVYIFSWNKMKRKYGIAMIVIALVMITPSSVAAEEWEDGWGIYSNSVYGFAIKEAMTVGLGYRGETKEIKLSLISDPAIGSPLRGLAIIELLFNSSVKPQSFTAYLEVNDTTYNLIDMVKNASIESGKHFWKSSDGEYYDCTYLLAYVYLFEDKMIYNESEYDGQLVWFDDTWIGGPNDSLPVYSLASDNIIASDDSNPITCIIGFDELTELIIIGTTSLIVMAIISVLIYRRTKT